MSLCHAAYNFAAGYCMRLLHTANMILNTNLRHLIVTTTLSLINPAGEGEFFN